MGIWFKTAADALANRSAGATTYIMRFADLTSTTIPPVGGKVFFTDTARAFSVDAGWNTDAATTLTGWAETTASLTPGATTNSTLRWSGTAWVENTSLLATSAGVITADTSFTAGEVGTATGAFILKGTTSGTGTISTDATVTKITSDKSLDVTGAVTASTNVTATTGNIAATAGSISAGTTVTGGTGVTATTGDVTATAGAVSANTTVTAGTGVTATTGNITASSGNVSASGTVTGGTGVIATTGGVTATAGGLTVTAGTTDINDTTNISGAVTLDNAAANSLTMAGTTNAVSLNGSGATSISLGGTTSTITLSGSGTKKVTGLDTPSAATDAANKSYVDSLAAGLDPKESVLLATTAAVTATYFIMSNTVGAGNGVILTVTGGLGTFGPGAGETIVTSGGTGTIVGVDHATAGTTTKIYIGGITGSALTTSFTSHSGGVTGLTISSIDTTSVAAFLANNAVGVSQIDSTTPAIGNRVLYKDQAVTDNNGIYNIKVVGSATLTQISARASDQDGTPTNEISTGNFTFVTGGSTNVGKGFVLSSTDAADPGNIAVHTDSKVFTQFSSAGGGVTSVPTESGTATPSAGSLTITGTPSINTSGSGSTVTIALAADLTGSSANGFTIPVKRVPFADKTTANALTSSSTLTYDPLGQTIGAGDSDILTLGDATQAFAIYQANPTTFGGFATVDKAVGPTASALVVSGNATTSGATGGLTIKSGDATSGASGNVQVRSGSGTTSTGQYGVGSGNASAGPSGAVQLTSGSGTSNTGGVGVYSGDASAGPSGASELRSGSGTTGTGAVSVVSGNASSGNSGNIIIQTGTATGTRGLITLNTAADRSVLTNSGTDVVSGNTTKAIADISFIRESVVRRNFGTGGSATLAGLGVATKFLVVVTGASGSYSSEVMMVGNGTGSTQGTHFDITEYAIVSIGTTPTAITYTGSAASSIPSLSVTATGSTNIAITAIPVA